MKIKDKLINFSNYLGNNCYLGCKNMRKATYNKKVIIYTLAYGEYLDYYFDYSLPALMHKSNCEALVEKGFEVEFLLYTIDKKDFILKKYKDHYFFNKSKIDIVEFDKGGEATARKIASRAIIDVFRRCLDERAVLYLAPPDTIVGNGSLFNSINASYGKNVCFASAHPRVSTSILSEIDHCNKQGIDNASLVNLAMRFPHDNFKYSDEDLEKNTTHKGISYRNVSPNLYMVTHNLPSPYVVFPIEEDYDFFCKCQDFNMWDREWLQSLIKTNRVKISGSSDLYFCVELTPEPFKADEELKTNQKYNDIGGSSFHHRVCRTFTAVWRST